MRERRGAALVLVLWVVAALAVLSASTGAQAKEAFAVARAQADIMRLRWRAEGCVHQWLAHASAEMGHAPGSDQLLALSPMAVEGCTIEAAPNGSLSLRWGDPEALARLIGATSGRRSDEAARLAEAAVAWARGLVHDQDEATRRERPPPGIASLLSPTLGGTLHPFVTFDSLPIALVAAPAEVLRALPGFDAEAANRVVALRRTGGLSGFGAILDGLGPESRQRLSDALPRVERLVTFRPDVIVVRSDAGETARGGPIVRVEVLVRVSAEGMRVLRSRVSIL